MFRSLSNLVALVGKAHLRCELSDMFSFNGRGAPARQLRKECGCCDGFRLPKRL